MKAIKFDKYKDFLINKLINDVFDNLDNILRFKTINVFFIINILLTLKVI